MLERLLPSHMKILGWFCSHCNIMKRAGQMWFLHNRSVVVPLVHLSIIIQQNFSSCSVSCIVLRFLLLAEQCKSSEGSVSRST